jgi:sirohydrochlorin cobaltochelatase
MTINTHFRRTETDSRPLAHGESREGLLLVGHGTRDPAGLAEFFAAADRIRELAGGRPLAPCFLELATPNIADGVEQLVRSGVTRIVVVPLLLFSAGHAKRDIPAAVAAATAGYPDVTIRQTSALECDPQILVLSERRFREAIAKLSPLPAIRTHALLVGRGSHDPEATAEMRRFAQLRTEQTPVGRMSVCFLAMQQPLLAEALADAAVSGFQRIVVQPHLLFAGELFDQVLRDVQRVAEPMGSGVFFSPQRSTLASNSTGTEKDSRPLARHWIVTAPLGPEPELAAAVMNLVEQHTAAGQQVT